jgi:hypothetical protein
MAFDLRMGQRSDQYRRCRSLICSVESMARFPFIRRKANRCQNVVVGKIRSVGRGEAEVLPEPRLALELSCCWQDCEASASDPDSLPLAVAFDEGRIALPALAPILRIAGPPFTRAVLTHLLVFRIAGDLAAVGIRAPTPLAKISPTRQLVDLVPEFLLSGELGFFSCEMVSDNKRI